jgi:hypothetical protein
MTLKRPTGKWAACAAVLLPLVGSRSGDLPQRIPCTGDEPSPDFLQECVGQDSEADLPPIPVPSAMRASRFAERGFSSAPAWLSAVAVGPVEL